MNTSNSPARPVALDCFPVAAFRDNYVWLATAGDQALVVDPGDAVPVIAALRARKLRLGAILLTHHHADHVGGVAALLDAFGAAATADLPTGVPVYGPATETIPTVTHPVRGGDVIEVAMPAARFQVFDIPGHTSGHIAFYAAALDGAAPLLFCGDTLFSCGCGRLFEGTAAQMLSSLDTLAALPDATKVYCAHEYTLANIRFALESDPGNDDLHTFAATAQAQRAAGHPTLPTTIGVQKAVNPFLRADDAAVRARVARHLGHPIERRLDVFAALRSWKDNFQ